VSDELEEMNIQELEEDNKSRRINRKINKLEKELEKQNEKLEKALMDVEHWKNEYYRAYADTQNLRKSLEKDHNEAMRYRAIGFIEELLPVLDSFHAVLANEVDDPKLKNYLIGFQYVYRNLVSALEEEGVVEITVKEGDEFDPHTMNAIEAVEVEENPNKVVKVIAQGYKLFDRIIRPANVIVTKKKENEEENINSNEA